MGSTIGNLREAYQLGSAPRKWLVTGQRVPGIGATPTRIAVFPEARAAYTFVRHNPAFSAILVSEKGEGLVKITVGERIEHDVLRFYATRREHRAHIALMPQHARHRSVEIP